MVMATNKPRFSVTFSDDTFEKIKKYQDKNKISTQSKAVANLVEMAVFEIEKSPDTTEATPEDTSLRSTLLQNYDQLNQEGQERLVETSDDMVASGKYIKTAPSGLGKEA